MKEPHHDSAFSLPNLLSGGFWISAGILLVSAIFAVGLFSLSLYVWAQSYEGRLPPHTFIAQTQVSGMDPEQVRQILQAQIDTILAQGVSVRLDTDVKTLNLATLVSSDLIEDVEFDLDTALAQAMQPHKQHALADAWSMFVRLTKTTTIPLPMKLQEDRLKIGIQSLYPQTETVSKNASFIFTLTDDQWHVLVEPGTTGKTFQWDPFFKTLSTQLSLLQTSPIELSIQTQPPTVSKEQALQERQQAIAALQAGPYTITLEQEPKQTWELTSQTLSHMIQPGNEEIDLSQEQLDVWIQTIANELNQPAQDARLNIENGRVVEFIESTPGQSVDTEALKLSLIEAVRAAASTPILIALQTTEPEITTGEVNTLGITQKLGIGVSSYKGSPSNRKGNIQNGVDLLNGILIAPGETFSLIKALSPFTADNGYLPELVIKGDKIEPEMGGGLCQIGTTTFRAVMNSGLPVTERRNHSLVVSYYNDPSNGNPGTDATIYEPSPDFKFTNDTGHYVLFQAENNTETQELQFSLWGTSDGRTGSYSPPNVTRWIPAGETKYIETTDLEPGKEKCQGAHVGADTSFTYTVIQADGTTTETLFESHYRPLPQICLVGVEAITPDPEINSSQETSQEPTLTTQETDVQASTPVSE